MLAGMRLRRLLIFVLSCASQASASPLEWKALANGVDYAVAKLPAESDKPGLLHVVRVDPRVAEIRLLSAKCSGSSLRTAGDWCRAEKLTAAINLGMYQQDYRSNVGHARCGSCVNNANWSSSYKSALVFGPKQNGLPRAAILDLDQPSSRDRTKGYECVVQNLRLVRAPGRTVWPEQPKRWSEAAIAQDKSGHILFLFCRTPYSMRGFCERVLALPLGIVNAMHVEGGPEASLSIHSLHVNLDLNGSYETGFRENDGAASQWPIPNVIGVAASGVTPSAGSGRPSAPP
jgi:hypothetical protein